MVTRTHVSRARGRHGSSSDGRSGGFAAPRTIPEARLLPSNEPHDVRGVAREDQRADRDHDHEGRRDRSHRSRGEDDRRQTAEDRSERNDAEDEHAEGEDRQRDERDRRGKDEQSSHRRRDPFTAAESEPRREDVPGHGGEAGPIIERAPTRRGDAGRRAACALRVDEQPRERDRAGALSRIAQEREDRRRDAAPGGRFGSRFQGDQEKAAAVMDEALRTVIKDR